MTQMVLRDYLGKHIQFKIIDGNVYVNATSLGEIQKLADWKRSKNTIELINELEAMENSHRLIISENGKATFIHESLFWDFAQYISVKFKVWCQTQIATLIREGNVQLPQLTEMEMISKIASSQDLALKRLEILENKFDAVVTLESGKQRKIQLAVSKRVYDIVESEEKYLYNTLHLDRERTEKEIKEQLESYKRKLFSGIYRDLKRKFGVASYKDIKVVEYEKALEFINNWIEDKEVI